MCDPNVTERGPVQQGDCNRAMPQPVMKPWLPGSQPDIQPCLPSPARAEPCPHSVPGSGSGPSPSGPAGWAHSSVIGELSLREALSMCFLLSQGIPAVSRIGVTETTQAGPEALPAPPPLQSGSHGMAGAQVQMPAGT